MPTYTNKDTSADTSTSIHENYHTDVNTSIKMNIHVTVPIRIHTVQANTKLSIDIDVHLSARIEA